MDMGERETVFDPESLVRNDRVTIVLFSGDLDKLQAALTIANGAAAVGMQATVFFTFWGLNALRKKPFATGARNWIQRLFAPLNRGGVRRLPLSRFNFAGLGPVLLRKAMRKVNMPTAEELLQAAREQGVKFIACTVTMGTLGIEPTDLREDWVDEYAGVISYLQTARQGSVNLFI